MNQLIGNQRAQSHTIHEIKLITEKEFDKILRESREYRSGDRLFVGKFSPMSSGVVTCKKSSIYDPFNQTIKEIRGRGYAERIHLLHAGSDYIFNEKVPFYITRDSQGHGIDLQGVGLIQLNYNQLLKIEPGQPFSFPGKRKNSDYLLFN